VTDRLKKSLKNPEDNAKDMQLLTFAGVVAIGYLYANAVFSGFPKYVVPIMPIIACVIAKFIWENTGKESGRKHLFFIALSLSAGIAYYIIFVKDWVYAIYMLRQAQSAGMAGSVIPEVVSQQTLYLLFPIAIFFISFFLFSIPFIKRLVLVLLVCLIAGNCALDIMQRNAAYAVNFGYGTEGAEELKSFLATKQPADVFSSIEGYVANIDGIKFHCINADVWDDPAIFLAFMQRYRPEYLIYGLGANTASQIRGTINAHAVKVYLKNGYDSRTMGSYNILLKRREHSYGEDNIKMLR
jgi:hypothetical protein